MLSWFAAPELTYSPCHESGGPGISSLGLPTTDWQDVPSSSRQATRKRTDGRVRGQQNRDAEFTSYVAARRIYLRRTAYLVCGDWHLAEDLVQSALVKLYAAWPRIRHEGAEDAYARRTIVRTYVDEKRRPWRRERLGLDGVDPVQPEPLSYEDTDALVSALKALPQRQRATVVLRYWCGLSVDETAADLGCSAGTVKSQTARAIGSLRQRLSLEEMTIERRLS